MYVCKYRKSSPSMAILTVAALAAIGGSLGSKAQDGARMMRPVGSSGPPASAKAATPTRSVMLGVGDRVKVAFFEMIDIAGGNAADQGAGNGLLQTFYQRMDLSGEYMVDQDGTIALPRLGAIGVEGRAVSEVQGELAAAFARVTGRAADVNISVVERAPVYVVGPVRTAGAYKYVPGMMVLHALSLAGGLDNGPVSTSELIEGMREMERLGKLNEQMKRLLARTARLEAERDGFAPVRTPAQLVAIAGDRGAETLLEGERTLLDVEQTRREHLRQEQVSAIQTARGELAAVKGKLAQLDLQRQIRSEYLGDLQKLRASGVSTRNGVINLRSELADIEVRRQDQLAMLAQVEGRLAQAERNLVRVTSDGAASLIKSMAATESELADVRLSLSTSESLAASFERTMTRALRGASGHAGYEIVRKGKDGATVVSADETTALQPGDVVKVVLRVPPPAAPAAVESVRARGASLEKSGTAVK